MSSCCSGHALWDPARLSTCPCAPAQSTPSLRPPPCTSIAGTGFRESISAPSPVFPFSYINPTRRPSCRKLPNSSVPNLPHQELASINDGDSWPRRCDTGATDAPQGWASNPPRVRHSLHLLCATGVGRVGLKCRHRHALAASARFGPPSLPSTAQPATALLHKVCTS